MRRVGVFAAAVAVAAALAAPAAGRAPLTASTSVAPRPAFFGERVTARAEIVVDKMVVEPSSVRFTPDFGPYAVVAAPRRSRADAGRVATLGYVYTLSCLDDGCLPSASTRTIQLKAAKVEASRRDGGTATLSVPWQPLLVAPRVPSAAAAGQPEWRIQLALPPVDYRVRPHVAVTVAWIVVAICACAGVGLIAWELVRRRRLALAHARALSELAQAVALVRQSEERPVDDRRRALARLSRVLAAHGDGDALLADDATRLAWDRPDPSPARIEALLNDVERRLAAR